MLAVLRMSARCVNTPMAQHDSSQTAAHVAALLVVCEEDVDRGEALIKMVSINRVSIPR